MSGWLTGLLRPVSGQGKSSLSTWGRLGGASCRGSRSSWGSLSPLRGGEPVLRMGVDGESVEEIIESID